MKDTSRIIGMQTNKSELARSPRTFVFQILASLPRAGDSLLLPTDFLEDNLDY